MARRKRARNARGAASAATASELERYWGEYTPEAFGAWLAQRAVAGNLRWLWSRDRFYMHTHARLLPRGLVDAEDRRTDSVAAEMVNAG
jgi:hypothetical protein